MNATEQATRELTPAECLSLLRTIPYGRLVFTEGALPAAIPVNFLLDPAGIVIRTGVQSSAARIADGTIVALQGDQVDLVRRTGWSVTVVGRARTVNDDVELARLTALPLQPWVAGERNTFIVVQVGIVSGRRIGGPAVFHDRP